MNSLLIATRNRHKVAEIQAILGNKFRYLSLDDFSAAPEVHEDAGTLAGNATKKAVELAKWLAAVGPKEYPGNQLVGQDIFVLADDSGLEVDALNGAPGVHSARFAALDTGALGNSAPAENNAKLLRLLKDLPHEKRTARFRCVLALTPVLKASIQSASPVCAADEFELQTELFEGVCDGHLDAALRGTGGFGYDPLFIPNGYEQTFGELPDHLKNQLSHRARALAKLELRLRANPSEPTATRNEPRPER